MDPFVTYPFLAALDRVSAVERFPDDIVIIVRGPEYDGLAFFGHDRNVDVGKERLASLEVVVQIYDDGLSPRATLRVHSFAFVGSAVATIVMRLEKAPLRIL